METDPQMVYSIQWVEMENMILVKSHLLLYGGNLLLVNFW